jgi:hypothetical protein
MVQNIDFSDRGITVDGESLGFPLTTARTREVFGEPRVTPGAEYLVQTWDSVGIKTFGPLDGTLVSILDVFVEGRSLETHTFNPTQGFSGTITVNGALVDSVVFEPGFGPDKLYAQLGPYILSRALDRPGGGFYDFFIRREDSDYFTRAEGIAAAVQALAIRWFQPAAATHAVDLGARGVTIDGTVLQLPTTPDALATILGAPREERSGDTVDWFWDELGLQATGMPGIVAAFSVVDGASGPHAPATSATSIHLTIDGSQPTAVSWDSTSATSRTKRLGDNELVRGALPTRSFWELETLSEIDYVAPVENETPEPVVEEETPAASEEPTEVAAEPTQPAAPAPTPPPIRGRAKNDYTLKKLVEPVLTFTDPAVKLLVIEELMFRQSKLKPRFEIRDFANWLPERLIDVDAEGATDIPEARAYFEALPVPSRFAYDVKALTIGATNDVAREIAPLGDGRTPAPTSLADLAQLPYLKKVTLEVDVPGAEALTSRGITVITEQ